MNEGEDLPVSELANGDVVDNTPIQLVDSNAVYLKMSVVPGALYGMGLVKPNWFFKATNVALEHADIREIEIELYSYAKTLDIKKSNNTLTVEPEDTRFLRLNTFAVDVPIEKRVSAGLKGSLGHTTLLAYFDRACVVSGDIDFKEKGIFRHQLIIPKAGIYKLIVSGQGEIKQVTAVATKHH